MKKICSQNFLAIFCREIRTSVGLQPLACSECGFESCRLLGYLCLVNVVCCEVEVCATGLSLVQRGPAGYMSSVIRCYNNPVTYNEQTKVIRLGRKERKSELLCSCHWFQIQDSENQLCLLLLNSSCFLAFYLHNLVLIWNSVSIFESNDIPWAMLRKTVRPTLWRSVSN
jgi:hypothetical protein